MASTRSYNSANRLARFDRVHNLYRNCILNELYYGHRLRLSSRVGLWLEVIIVLGTGTSGVSGWIIWTQYPACSVLWAIIAAASTLFAALKPILQTDAKIERYSALFSAYRQLAISMKEVEDEIGEMGSIGKDIDKEIERVRKRYCALSEDDDPRPSPKLVEELQERPRILCFIHRRLQPQISVQLPVT